MRQLIEKKIWPALLLLCSATAMTADIQQIFDEGEQRTAEGKEAQEKITAITKESDELARQYRNLGKIIDGLNIYNDLLQQQVDSQTNEINTLRKSIEGVSLIERQIIPLMINMIDALEIFIAEDMPFLPDEREQRIQRLRDMMSRPDVTAAEKLRQVLEAYQIENEYGRTLEAYKGTVDVNGTEREVDFLRVGRIGLLYQTFQGDISGVWNKQNKRWEILSPEQYKRSIASGLRIARKQIAPDLLLIPVNTAQEVAP